MKTTCVSFLAKIEPQLLLVALSVVATLKEGEAEAEAWSPSPTCGRKERGKLGLLFLFPLSFFPLPLPASRKEFGGAGGQKEEKGGGRKKA